MDSEKINQVVKDAAKEINGKKNLTCPQAFVLSKEYDISLKVIGDACNKLKIKMSGCQLGCFK